MLNISVNTICKILGVTDYTGLDLDIVITSVTLDSRKAVANSLFVALKGNNSDGHDFVAGVSAKGCVSLVNHDFSAELPNLIRVANPELALGLIAKHWRQINRAKIVGITGSNGKTTLKEMLKIICELEYGADFVSATTGNLNNHLGVPLSLLGIDPEDQVAIIEMGMNHSGEIEYLTSIAIPDVVVVNNVMLAHVGNFNSVVDVALAKGEIYTNLNEQAVALVNLAEIHHGLWSENIALQEKLHHVTRVEFGTSNTNCYLVDYNETTQQLKFVLNAKSYKVNLQVKGLHNALNAITVIALANALGVKTTNIIAGLEQYVGYSRRLEYKKGIKDTVIIDDTYNANLDSVKAAVDVLAKCTGERWFVFADLKEMGKFTTEIHSEVARYIQGKVDVLVTLGEDSLITHDLFVGRKIHCDSIMGVVKYCIDNVPSGSTILVKGSNSMKLDQVVNQITI